MFKIFSKKKEKIKTCNEEINILDIRNNTIYTRNDYIIMALKINSINMIICLIGYIDI